MNDRDFSYGYGGFIPMNNAPISNNSFAVSQFNDMNDRISRLERQIKRMEQRLARLETPYANTNNYNNEPDNNMYMM